MLGRRRRREPGDRGDRQEHRLDKIDARTERAEAVAKKRQALASLIKWVLIAAAAVYAAFMGRGLLGQEVQGRSTATAGQLVVLKAAEAEEPFVWVYDRAVYGDAMVCNETKTFAIVPNQPGRLVVWLVQQTGGGLVTTPHVVAVQGGKPPATGPAVPTGGDLARLTGDLVKRYGAAVTELNDPPTAQAIIREWRAALGAVRGSPDLQAAGVVLGDAWGRAMATREGKSRYVDWLGGFRKPLNADIDAAIKAGVINSPADMAAVVEAIALALPQQAEDTR